MGVVQRIKEYAASLESSVKKVGTDLKTVKMKENEVGRRLHVAEAQRKPGGSWRAAPPPEAPFGYLYEMSPLKRGFRYIFFE